MKIIFLDIDGVLNSIIHSSIYKIKNNHTINNHSSDINSYNLDLLRLLVEATQSNIVISSTWRHDPTFIDSTLDYHHKIKVFKDFFSQLGWDNAPIIGLTPVLHTIRGHEVAVFLDKLSQTVHIEDFIILDDDSDFIIGQLAQLPIDKLKMIGLDTIEAQEKTSSFWKNQKLLVTNKLTGLTYNDAIEILQLWSPNHHLVKVNHSYQPYLHRYGKRW